VGKQTANAQFDTDCPREPVGGFVEALRQEQERKASKTDSDPEPVHRNAQLSERDVAEGRWSSCMPEKANGDTLCHEKSRTA
jgi:hypothetical protein